jgi:CRP/FNR family transcriptional regulator, cyclic AMP receptor protein
MPPDRQPGGSPRRKIVTRPTATEPAFQAGRSVSNPRLPANRRRAFDPDALLATIAEGRKVWRFAKKQRIFAQGDQADAVFYIQTGKVRLTVVSKTGQEATIGMLGEGEFFGEGSIAGQALRMGSAIALTDCSVLGRSSRCPLAVQ